MKNGAATRLYRFVLRLYPASFRRQFGAEMLQTFETTAPTSRQGAVVRASRSGWQSSPTTFATSFASMVPHWPDGCGCRAPRAPASSWR